MGDLISREALLEVCRWYIRDSETARDFRAAEEWRGAEDEVKAAPAVDAVEVVHSEWVKEEDRVNHWHCKNCGLVEGMAHYMMHYCPNCGAKMEERKCE